VLRSRHACSLAAPPTRHTRTSWTSQTPRRSTLPSCEAPPRHWRGEPPLRACAATAPRYPHAAAPRTKAASSAVASATSMRSGCGASAEQPTSRHVVIEARRSEAPMERLADPHTRARKSWNAGGPAGLPMGRREGSHGHAQPLGRSLGASVPECSTLGRGRAALFGCDVGVSRLTGTTRAFVTRRRSPRRPAQSSGDRERVTLVCKKTMGLRNGVQESMRLLADAAVDHVRELETLFHFL
jgi:hypothetical protein